MGLDSAQGLGKGIHTRSLFVLLFVLALFLIGAFSSQTARADLLDPVTDLLDQTEEVVETTTGAITETVAAVTEAVDVVPVVEIVPPIVEDVVELVPPMVEDLVEEVVEVIPPVAEEVVEVIPLVAEEVAEVIPLVAEEVVEVIPPVFEIVPPFDVSFVPPATIIDPIQNQIPIPDSAAQGANPLGQQSGFDVTVTDIVLFDRIDLIGDANSILSSSIPNARVTRTSASNQAGPPLAPRAPVAGLLPAAVGGSGTSGLISSAPLGGFFGGNVDPYGFFAALAALLALCLTGLIRDHSRSTVRSVFLRHEARPG